MTKHSTAFLEATEFFADALQQQEKKQGKHGFELTLPIQIRQAYETEQEKLITLAEIFRRSTSILTHPIPRFFRAAIYCNFLVRFIDLVNTRKADPDFNVSANAALLVFLLAFIMKKANKNFLSNISIDTHSFNQKSDSPTPR